MLVFCDYTIEDGHLVVKTRVDCGDYCDSDFIRIPLIDLGKAIQSASCGVLDDV